MQPITSEDIANAEASASGGAFISNRFRIDNDTNEKPASGGNYLISGICSIVAFILFVVALVIIYQDWQFLKVA